MRMKVAVAQIDAAVGNVEKNIERHIASIKKAVAKKAGVIVFPELSLTGYSVRDLNWDVAINVAEPAVLSELLKLSKLITIIAGGVEERENFGLYNSAFVLEDGKLYSGHRKIYPPTYGMFEEMRYFSQGNDVRNFNVQTWQARHSDLRRFMASFSSVHPGERRSGCSYHHSRQSHPYLWIIRESSIGHDQQRTS